MPSHLPRSGEIREGMDSDAASEAKAILNFRQKPRTRGRAFFRGQAIGRENLGLFPDIIA